MLYEVITQGQRASEIAARAPGGGGQPGEAPEVAPARARGIRRRGVEQRLEGASDAVEESLVGRIALGVPRGEAADLVLGRGLVGAQEQAAAVREGGVGGGRTGEQARITSYNVCYTKLLRSTAASDTSR